MLRILRRAPNEPQPAGTLTGSEKELIAQGDKALAESKCREAVAAYHAAQAAAPNDVAPYWRSAFADDLVAGYTNNFSSGYLASHDLDRALVLSPNSAPIYVLRGETTQFETLGAQTLKAMQSMERYALSDYAKAIQIAPNIGEAYTGSYIAYNFLGDKVAAQEALQKARQLDPVGVETFFQLQGQINRALAERDRQQAQRDERTARAVTSLFNAIDNLAKA